MAVQKFPHLGEKKGSKKGSDSISVGKGSLTVRLHPIDGKEGGHLLADGIKIKADQVRLTGSSGDHAETGGRENDPAKEKTPVEFIEQPAT